MTMPTTQMPSTRLPAHIFYAIEADRMDRDPVQEPDVNGRATVPMGRGFKWERFNKGVELIYVDDAEGRPRGLTPTQYRVFQLAIECIDGPMLTMRQMAVRLGVAASTISRALTKFVSWGLLAVIVGLGRFAGLVILRRAKADGLDRFRDAAKARVRRWSEAAQRRLSRLQVNVAPYLYDRGVDSLYYYILGTSTKGATLTAQLNREWRSDELVDIV